MAEPRTAEVTLDGVASSVPAARAFVREVLRRWGQLPLADSVALVASELATNAVLHARSAFVVRLSQDVSGALRLEVVDGSAREPVRRSSGPSATTGRGLGLVQRLGSDWGVQPLRTGKAVWVRFDAGEEGRGDQPGPATGGRGQQQGVDPTGPRACAA